jgi:hypothetical protein
MPDHHDIAKPHFAVIALPDLSHVIAKPDRCEPDLVHVIAKPHHPVIAMPDHHVIAPAFATRGPFVPIVVHVLGQNGLVFPALATRCPSVPTVVARATRRRPRPHLWMRQVPGPTVKDLAEDLEEVLRLTREVRRLAREVLRFAALSPAVGVLLSPTTQRAPGRFARSPPFASEQFGFELEHSSWRVVAV